MEEKRKSIMAQVLNETINTQTKKYTQILSSSFTSYSQNDYKCSIREKGNLCTLITSNHILKSSAIEKCSITSTNWGRAVIIYKETEVQHHLHSS